MQNLHKSVLLAETIDSLGIKNDGVYVDLTLGRAGHSCAILKKLTTGHLFGFDKDVEAIEKSSGVLSQISSNFTLIHSDFKNIKSELEKHGIDKVDGIIADLGISSPQVDDGTRGFSYNKDSRLDMRMDQREDLDAHFIINNWSEEQLVEIFRNYADVMLPKRVAKGIFENRPINSTLELVDVIRDSLPAAVVRKKNPSKAVFQALRIAVNNEMGSLDEMLDDAISLLKKDGVLSVITFHSIEDRIVKKCFGHLIKDDTGKLPIMVIKKFVAKQIRPSKNEIEINKRARSAKLRTLRKLV